MSPMPTCNHPTDQDKSHPRAHVAWPPLTDIKWHPRHARSGQGDERKLRIRGRRLAGCQNRDPAVRLGGVVGFHSPGTRSSELQFKTVRLPIKWVGPGRRRVSGGADILQEEARLWANLETYACGQKNGWCLLFRIASWTSVNLFVLGAKIIISVFMISQKFIRVRPAVRETRGSTVNETDPWTDKREPLLGQD